MNGGGHQTHSIRSRVVVNRYIWPTLNVSFNSMAEAGKHAGVKIRSRRKAILGLQQRRHPPGTRSSRPAVTAHRNNAQALSIEAREVIYKKNELTGCMCDKIIGRLAPSNSICPKLKHDHAGVGLDKSTIQDCTDRSALACRHVSFGQSNASPTVRFIYRNCEILHQPD